MFSKITKTTKTYEYDSSISEPGSSIVNPPSFLWDFNFEDEQPYNLIANADSSLWQLSLAVPGFKSCDIEVTTEENILVITGFSDYVLPPGFTSLHNGIANRKFSRQFTMENHIEVLEVLFGNGIITVNLVLNKPEQKKSKKYPIRDI